MSEIKYIDIKEFRKLGYLQELNRQFLHPLGMALSIEVDEDGNESLSGIWDYREDLEGMLYDDSLLETDKFKSNVKYVEEQWKGKERTRKEILGYMIQTIDKNKL